MLLLSIYQILVSVLSLEMILVMDGAKIGKLRKKCRVSKMLHVMHEGFVLGNVNIYDFSPFY